LPLLIQTYGWIEAPGYREGALKISLRRRIFALLGFSLPEIVQDSGQILALVGHLLPDSESLAKKSFRGCEISLVVLRRARHIVGNGPSRIEFARSFQGTERHTQPLAGSFVFAMSNRLFRAADQLLPPWPLCPDGPAAERNA
jgi:hypothetical protein